jgi:hypothetical protein
MNPTASGESGALAQTVAPRRKVLWCLLVFVATFPVVFAIVLFSVGAILGAGFSALLGDKFGNLINFGLSASVGLTVVFLILRTGLRRGSPAGTAQLVGWSIAAAASLTLTALLGFGIHHVVRSSKYKAMIPRQMAATADQLWLEYGDAKIFIRYEDLVGPTRYIKAEYPVDGEDPAALFPIRFAWNQPFDVRLPDGTTVRRAEVFAKVGRSGIVATFPNPQEETGVYDPQRVYLLPNGVTFRDNRVVNLPPDPAGMEGRDQDGVHVYTTAGRWEITYRGGVPDGPFRAYYPNGKLQVEATYVKGRVVGPAWHYLPDGRKYDELSVTLEEAMQLQGLANQLR